MRGVLQSSIKATGFPPLSLLPTDAILEALPDEAALDVEEQALMAKAEALERAVAEHRAQKAAALLARRRAEERQATETALAQWQAELRAETEGAISRLNEQRVAQLAKCADFEAKLQANIEAMQAMQLQVRRRAAAIDTAFDATVQRLSGSYTDAVARRAASVADQQHVADHSGS